VVKLNRDAERGHERSRKMREKIAADAPPLTGLELFFWTAFAHLQSHRPIGAMGGMGQIPYLDIVQYMRLMDVDEWESAARIIVLVDNHQLRLMSEKVAVNSK
jgi:hypothetical protein